MEVGLVGHIGLVVEVTVKSQDLEVVQILLLQMEVLTAMVAVLIRNLAQEDNAKLMEVGQVGHLGLVVEVTVRCQDLEVAQIPLLSMEVLTVLAIMKKTNLAQEEDVKSMEVG